VSFIPVREFENAIAEFYGSSYGVATDCCTHAIELCLRYSKSDNITIPSRTYLSIPFTAEKLGLKWEWDDTPWSSFYFIGNTNIIDAATLWKKGSYVSDSFMCLSFQFQKHLSLGRGGMILTDNKKASEDLKRMSHDGRSPDKKWREQNIASMGYHYYMTPETAQAGLDKLQDAKNREPKKWKWEDWPDLRQMDVFKNEQKSTHSYI
tara:strand:- start:8046 stop:8666 length:621 start_codon:yes stop_codon:yes gene_type:complete